MSELQTGVAPIRSQRDWTREFVLADIQTAVSSTVANAVPDLNVRLRRDPAAYLEVLTVSGMVANEAERMLSEYVRQARIAGFSWETIGETLGISGFAAQQRFSAATPPAQLPSPAPVEHQGSPDLPPIGTLAMTDPGLFAGQEIECLNRAGKYGWHAVDYTGNKWTLAFDHRQWQHIYTDKTSSEPYGDGWQLIKPTKKKAYWSRPTNLPILPGNPPIRAFVSDRRVKRAVQK